MKGFLEKFSRGDPEVLVPIFLAICWGLLIAVVVAYELGGLSG